MLSLFPCIQESLSLQEQAHPRAPEEITGIQGLI